MENPVNVAHYISELLFHHDCVVVPDFGGFVCSYASARIHPARHAFSPPSKQVVFNKYLQQNDGLLAHAIAAAVPCSFEEAMIAIKIFVEQSAQQLKSGQVIDLKNIGRLSLDPERNYRFEADLEVNYRIDAFGLSAFQSMPILRDTAAAVAQEVLLPKQGEALSTGRTRTRPLKEREDRVIAETRKPAAIKRRNRLARAALLLLIPIAVLSLVLPFNKQLRQNMAVLGWFGSDDSPQYQPVNWFDASQLDTAAFAYTANIRRDTSTFFYLRLAGEGRPIVVNRYVAERESTHVAPERKTWHRRSLSQSHKTGFGTYHIIAGAFSIAENAEKYRSLLKEKGYETQVLDSIDSRLIHISLARFKSKREAEQFLQIIHGSVPDAWIFKK